MRNTPLRALAEKYGLASHYPLHRHRKHLPERLTLAKHAEDVAAASTLLQRVEGIIGECKAIVDSAKKGKDWSAAVAALREIRSNLELLGKLSGELQAAAMSVRIGVHNTTVNVSTAPATEIEVDIQIAKEIAEATNNFCPPEIARLQVSPPSRECGPAWPGAWETRNSQSINGTSLLCSPGRPFRPVSQCVRRPSRGLVCVT